MNKAFKIVDNRNSVVVAVRNTFRQAQQFAAASGNIGQYKIIR